MIFPGHRFRTLALTLLIQFIDFLWPLRAGDRTPNLWFWGRGLGTATGTEEVWSTPTSPGASQEGASGPVKQDMRYLFHRHGHGMAWVTAVRSTHIDIGMS